MGTSDGTLTAGLGFNHHPSLASTSIHNTSLEAPLIQGQPSFRDVSERISGIVERGPGLWWWIATGISGLLSLMLVGLIGYLFWEGTGVWGLQVPVGWGWDITNFVFWVGIGHAGTLISAILFLLRQKWRTSINRFSEAMTLFAVLCAAMFPSIHVGRPWLLYFVMPIPNQMALWPNFRSPLLWDFFAVGTYFTVSLLFWYLGLVPDLATLRDRATARIRSGAREIGTRIRQVAFGLLALGWRGSNRQWKHYELAYLILAGISTPLVLSVHSIVSTDFATSVIPGWHTTIFPPYFVAGAIFSGFGMVMTLAILARLVYPISDYITINHLEKMAKVLMVTGMMVGYAYAMEFFIAWYSGNDIERFTFINRAFGTYAWAYWTMVSCNVLIPQILWFKRLRTSVPVLFVLSIFVNIGMWFERFVIIVSSLANDYLPAVWAYFRPTWVDVMTFVGSIGLFLFLFLLFLRFLPMIAMSEVKGVLPQAETH
ncbi:MAG: hydrogenase [Calditrichaeota bacterium]|nr:hydrogenase [Calditrichota bacterium]